MKNKNVAIISRFNENGKMESVVICDEKCVDIISEIFDSRRPHREWSQWKDTNNHTVMGNVYTRTNGKCIQMRVKSPSGWITSRASCHPMDKFDQKYGELLAYCRLQRKVYRYAEDRVIDFMGVI